jgi:hypothetical protein
MKAGIITVRVMSHLLIGFDVCIEGTVKPLFLRWDIRCRFRILLTFKINHMIVEMIHKTFKSLINLNKKHEGILSKHFECAWFVFNHSLGRRVDHYADSRNGLTYHDTAAELTEMKKLRGIRVAERGEFPLPPAVAAKSGYGLQQFYQQEGGLSHLQEETW